MKSIIVLLFLLSSYSSHSQSYFLGRTKESILNEFRQCKLDSISLNDIYLKCGNDNLAFGFKNGLCSNSIITCDEEAKNALVANLLENGYAVKVTNEEHASFYEFDNGIYFIQVISGKVNNPEWDLFIVMTIYKKDLKE